MTQSSTIGRSLKTVSVIIAIVAIVSIVAVAYSGYAEFNTLVGLSNGTSKGLTERAVTNGTSETIYINASITNNGLLPIGLAFACDNIQPGVACESGSITVPPGQQGVLRIGLTVQNYSRFESGQVSLLVDGNFTFRLIPFATMQVSANLGPLVEPGGSQG